MRAITINNFGGRDTLTLADDVPTARFGEDEVLIAVKAAGVNPVDAKIREGKLAGRLPHEFPLIPGWDAAGIIAGIGENVTSFLPGDEVFAYCRKPVVQYGTYAEYVAVPTSFVAKKPVSLSFEEAAAVPLACLTAYQSLFEGINLHQGETVLIQAAAGGVGSFAVQLAALRGAFVIGTARSVNHEYIRSLGVGRAIDYTLNDVSSLVGNEFPAGIDAVFDTIGGEATFTGMDLLKPGGRIVSILTPKDERVEEYARKNDLRYEYVFVRPDAGQLEQIARLFAAGKLHVHIDGTFPLEQAAEAQAQIESRHTKGKIVLTIPR
jgi:NADPH:quinone reductase-like Zn-dependent oxidoreductase